MDIKQKELNGHGSFFIEEDSVTLGTLTYTRYSDHEISLDHTEVDDRLKGKGAGRQLVSKAVEWARGNNMKITPRCSYAKTLFDRLPEFKDVLA